MWNINLKKLAGVKELISALEKYHFIAETIHKDMFWFSHERNGVLVIDLLVIRRNGQYRNGMI